MTSIRPHVRALAAAVSILVLAACAPGAAKEPESAAPAPAATATFSHEQLCEVAGPMLVAVPRAFIGTDDHVQQFIDLAQVAPDNLQEHISLLEAHYRDDVTPAVPDSQDFVNFPPHIQDAALELDGTLRELC